MFSIWPENGSPSPSRRLVARREIVDAAEQLGRGARGAEIARRRARRRERIERNVDAIELAEILAAILQVIVDLQRGAQRVVRRPGGAALAVHIEHEAPDRHRRVAAIVNEIVPVLVAQLGHVHAERDEQVLRVARRQAALGERVAQPHGFRIVVALPEQIRFQPVELLELLAFGSSVVWSAMSSATRTNS